MEKINFREESKNVSVLLSAFNEENNIKELINRILNVLPNCEILLTHGGNDNTAIYAKELAKKLKNKNIKIILNPNDRGAGHGLIISILNCSRPIMVNIDSDIQFPPEEIPSLLKPIITKKYKVVFGSRFLKNSGKKNYKGSFLRDKGNMIIAYVVSILTGRKFTDISAGFKAWTREAIINTGYEDEKYCSFPELAIRCAFNNFDICEVPIKDYADRIHGHSIHQSRTQLIIGGMNFILKSFRTFLILKFNKFNQPQWTKLIPKKSFEKNQNIII